jgi:hypothetical protein
MIEAVAAEGYFESILKERRRVGFDTEDLKSFAAEMSGAQFENQRAGSQWPEDFRRQPVLPPHVPQVRTGFAGALQGPGMSRYSSGFGVGRNVGKKFRSLSGELV